MRPHPHLYEINTWPWLERLSTAAARRVTLGSVPAAEWDRLRALGFDLVYLMGVWERSEISRQIARSEPSLFGSYDQGLPGWTPRDVVGSPYAVRCYAPDPHLGTWRDLALAREAVNSRGMRLVLDFVPNHTAFDHPWINSHPHRYVTASLEQFRTAPANFRAVESDASDGPLYIACARDPFFPPWTDVAQLNYFEPETRKAMIAELSAIAQHCDGVRCDMAMLVLGDVFARSWGWVTGRADPPVEFWADARNELPDLTMIAEAYWNLEARLQQLGFSYTYDKGFYDAVAAGDAAAVRRGLTPDEFHARGVRFLENHDEPRSMARLGEARIEAAAVLLTTAPGVRMYYDGQLEGRERYSPVQLGRWAEEPARPVLTTMYEHLLRCADHAVFHDGRWEALTVHDVGDVGSMPHPSLVALWWHLGPEFRLIVANFADREAHGFLQLPAVLPPGDAPLVFEDQLRTATYRRDRAELSRQGLYVRLEGGKAHLFCVRPDVSVILDPST